MHAEDRHRFNNRIGLPALTDSIGFLANPGESRGNHMPPLCPTSIEMVAVRELMLRAQVVLPKNLSVGLQLLRTDRFARRRSKTFDNARAGSLS